MAAEEVMSDFKMLDTKSINVSIFPVHCMEINEYAFMNKNKLYNDYEFNF